MTTEELTELLKNELTQGIVTVSPALVPTECRIDWNLNGSNIVTVFDKAILNADSDAIKEDFIKPTVMHFKQLRRRDSARQEN